MSISLYRKYRPVRFEDVIGQDHVTRTLVNAIKQDRVSHAYLFAGPRGTGKTTTAKILAMSLNCEAGQGTATISPDGSCSRCQAIRRGQSLDVIEIDAASNRGIDDIRDIRDNSHFAPVEGRMKVYIVDEVHMLTTEAFNALLKILEEPPAHVIFILATTEPHKVLPTILSRCQRFDFRRPTLAEVCNVLKGVAAREGIEVSENTLAVIARSAAGSFRDAIGTLDQLASYCESAISLQDALALLGVAEQDLLFELVDIVAEGNTKEALLFVERLAQNGADFNQFMRDMLGHLRDLYVVRHTENAPAGLAATQERLESLRSQANRNATGELVHFIDSIGEAQRAVRQGADPRLELEVVLIRLTQPRADQSLRGIAARLEKLEAGGGWDHRPPGTTGPPVAASPGERTGAASAPPGEGSQPTTERLSSSETVKAADPTPLPPTSPEVEGQQVPLTIDHIKRAWGVLLERIKGRRPGLHAVVAEGKPDALEEGTLVIRFPHGMDFQAGQLESPENALLMAEELQALTGRRLHVVPRVSSAGERQPQEEAAQEHVRILRTSELIEHLQKEFGARLIDDGTTS
ncbi:MAG: DNA polymerase III subunit gamma/tau [Gaiellales bacterium]|nr:DNA polymerase III subunit gamma/tau [Gaiellales bacterium]